MAQKYRIAVIAAKAVLSPALMVSIFFMELDFRVKKGAGQASPCIGTAFRGD